MFCEVLLFTVLFSICAPKQMLIQQEQRGILRYDRYSYAVFFTSFLRLSQRVRKG